MQDTHFHVGRNILAVIGLFAVTNLGLDIAATNFIRSHPNAISRLEGSLARCDAHKSGIEDVGFGGAGPDPYADAFMAHESCIDSALARGLAEKNWFVANCDIDSVGPFRVGMETGDAWVSWRSPLYYDASPFFFLGGACFDELSGKNVSAS